ncbi:MAG: AAA family ATPase [Nitrospira sp.]|nr:AAA family ATPase [Nitrospira sp.]
MSATVEFCEAMKARGITPPDEIVADGELHRFKSSGDDRKKNGAYVFHQDGKPAGWFCCHRLGVDETWSAKTGSPMTAEERAEHKKRIAELQRLREEEEKHHHEEAAERAQQILAEAKPAPSNHPYLTRKKIKAHGAFVTVNGELLIQVMIEGKPSSLQFIAADGAKRFLSGGAVAGGSHTFSNMTNAKVILICEGFATGAAVYEASGLPVIIAFSASNLLAVAQATRKQNPTAQIVICGDHDKSGVGQKAAREAANTIEGIAVIPQSEGDDWNDVAVRDGSDAVRSAIDRATGNYDRIEVQDLAGNYRVAFASHDLTLTFGRLSENARGVHAELTISDGRSEILSDTDVSLKSKSSRDGIAKSLKENGSSVNWKKVLDIACGAVLKRFRNGEPVAKLDPADSIHIPFVVNPLVYRGHQTLIFAPGGSYKSFLMLYIALLACAGLRQNGIAALRINVLYLDYELDKNTVGARLKAIQAGHPELAHVRPFYRRCAQPLHLELHYIAAEVAEHNIELVIVDSAALACGGDLASPESAIRLQQALRRIGCASIVLAHTAKSTVEGQDRSAYGTVFFRELARNVLELSKHEGSDRVVLSQTGTACKNSFGRKLDPLGFELSFLPDRVRFSSFNPSTEEDTEFESKLPLRDRIKRLLSDSRKRSSKEIAEELHANEESVRVTLSGNKALFVRTGPHRNALWHLITLAQAPDSSLIPIINAPIINQSLTPLMTDSEDGHKQLNIQDKHIINAIINDHYSQSLINKRGTICTPPLIIEDSTVNHTGNSSSKPEPDYDLGDESQPTEVDLC